MIDPGPNFIVIHPDYESIDVYDEEGDKLNVDEHEIVGIQTIVKTPDGKCYGGVFVGKDVTEFVREGMAEPKTLGGS